MKKKIKSHNNVLPLRKESQEKLALQAEAPNMASEELKYMTAQCLMNALECKDPYTFRHSIRVSFYSCLLGRELGLSDDEIKELELCGLFHDLGKISIPDNILQKPYQLSEDEFLIMKKHPEDSEFIIKNYEQFKNIAKYVRHHHERWDGRGYPDKLKEEEIPFFSRIVLIADTFDSMTSTRPYRQGLPNQVAYDELIQFSNIQFDGNLVKKFIAGMKKEEKDESTEIFAYALKRTISKKAA